MEQKTIRNHTFLPKNSKFVNYYEMTKNDLKHVTPMKNRNLDMKFLEVFLVKCELASDRLSFLSKMGLEFFSAGLEFF